MNENKKDEGRDRITLKVWTLRDGKTVFGLKSSAPPHITFAALLHQDDPAAPVVDIVIEMAPEEFLREADEHARECTNPECPTHKAAKPARPAPLKNLRARDGAPVLPDIKGSAAEFLTYLSGEFPKGDR